MAKSSVQYECQNCGAVHQKWQGQCGSCGKWNTLVETVVSKTSSSKALSPKQSARFYKLSEIDTSPDKFGRLDVGSQELAQVLGGGLVKGSVLLLAGEPGIGKSTLLSQMTLYFAARHGLVLYVCGEESIEQVKLRLDRLSKHKKTSPKALDSVLLLPENRTELITATMQQQKPILTIVDSIQTLVSEQLTGMAGSVGQVRESGNQLLNTAKHYGLSTFLVGHVTKEGSLAGPKVLEHMVDSVLHLTGERSGRLRLLRAAKNRFGAVDEVGVFEMADTGLIDVTNASTAFVEDLVTENPGAVTTVLMEGTRPILAEVQALVVPSQLPTPRRVSEGIKISKLNVLCAVLQKHAKLNLSDKDVFVNVVGGLKAQEPAADLAIALAIASSAKNKKLQTKQVAVGEVGLLGELRSVSFMEKRSREAKKLGYDMISRGKQADTIAKIIATWL